MTALSVKRLHPDAVLPRKAYPTDAGWDLSILGTCRVRSWHTTICATGLAIQPPVGFFASIEGRSSSKASGIEIWPGVMDAGYTGEWLLRVTNRSDETVILAGRVAQFILLPVPEVDLVVCDTLPDLTPRGGAGFGSSGR